MTITRAAIEEFDEEHYQDFISSVQCYLQAGCSAEGVHHVDEHYMGLALHEAVQAGELGEVPIGAVMVHQNVVISRSRNRMEETGDPTRHAELQAIQDAVSKLGRFSMPECTLYVTVEPCPMCAGAILQARVGTLVYGARNHLLGADGSWVSLFRAPQASEEPNLSSDDASAAAHGDNKARLHPFHPNVQIRRDVLVEDSATLMRQFFKKRRSEPSKKPVHVADDGVS